MDKMRDFGRLLVNIFKKLPVLNGLVECRLADHRAALWELSVNVCFSTFPLWVAACISLFAKEAPGWGSLVANGELLLVATSLSAPALYYAASDPPGEHLLSCRKFLIFTVLLLVIFSSIIFTMQRLKVDLADGPVFNFSVGAFALSIGLLYLTTVYQKLASSAQPGSEMRNQEKNFSEQLREHRR